VQGRLEILELPGDHDMVFRLENIQVLAEQLRTLLEKSTPNGPDAAEGNKQELMSTVK
jgi:hypothetical protein